MTRRENLRHNFHARLTEHKREIHTITLKDRGLAQGVLQPSAGGSKGGWCRKIDYANVEIERAFVSDDLVSTES